jgi:hypothetical protein
LFQLGGDSLLSIQVVSRAARAGWRIRPRQVFEAPTLARLAHELGFSDATSASRFLRRGSRTLTQAGKPATVTD